jgi:hypothetical protein
MTKFEAELLETLKGIEAALLLLRVPNTVYVPQPTYVPPVFPTFPGTTWINTTTNSTPRC